MSEDRLYDPNLALKLTAEISGPRTAAVLTPEPSVIHDPTFERHGRGFMSEAFTAVAGLTKVLTPEGRVERARDKAARLQKQPSVINYMANRMANPRDGRTDPAEKIGWVGTHKRELSTPSHPDDEAIPANVRPEDLSNLGYQLMGKTPSEVAFRNSRRPVTSGEKAGSRRLEKHWEKRTRAQNLSKWFSDSYRWSLSRGHHRLSDSEQGHTRKTLRAIRKQDHKDEKHMKAFIKIGNSNDWRGAANNWRINRNLNRADRIERQILAQHDVQAQEADRVRNRLERREAKLDHKQAVYLHLAQIALGMPSTVTERDGVTTPVPRNATERLMARRIAKSARKHPGQLTRSMKHMSGWRNASLARVTGDPTNPVDTGAIGKYEQIAQEHRDERDELRTRQPAKQQNRIQKGIDFNQRRTNQTERGKQRRHDARLSVERQTVAAANATGRGVKRATLASGRTAKHAVVAVGRSGKWVGRKAQRVVRRHP